MEAKINGETHRLHDTGVLDMNAMGRKGFEWDLNEWQWDGSLFVATSSNATPSCCRSKQLLPIVANGGPRRDSYCPDDIELGVNEKGKCELEKRRRIIVVEDDDPVDKAGFLSLKLGKHVCPTVEVCSDYNGVNNNKRTKVQPSSLNRGMCQVEGCGSDLSDAKDYHRRHKVCEMHAKANKAIVGNSIQRFCQQCSRFHLLQEFDDGKRSCRRRLAGHNRRRRKTNPHSVTNENSLPQDQDSRYLLISLLRILSNLQSTNSEQSEDQVLLSHFLRSLASLAGSFDAGKLLKDPEKTGNSAGTCEVADPSSSSRCIVSESTRLLHFNTSPNCTMETHECSPGPTNKTSVATPATKMLQTTNAKECPLDENLQALQSRTFRHDAAEQDLGPEKAMVLNVFQQVSPVKSSEQRVISTDDFCRLKSFDLNNVYVDGQDGNSEPEKVTSRGNLRIGHFDSSSWALQESHHLSPPQMSGTSDSSSAKSPASSSGDATNRTDRIVFKIFGKDPNDLPLVLRSQIIDWLSDTPTDIESYIRPGCIILTVYLRLPESKWEEICCDLGSSLKRLLDLAHDDFWRTGWVYARVQHQIAFICNGQIVLNTPLHLSDHDHCKILSITPIAVPISGRADFTIKGFNLSQAAMRLLCAFEGKYLVQEAAHALVDDTDTLNSNDGSQYLNFSCSVPDATGRGFIEVEDYSLNGAFFPFIIAEPEICSEVRILESIIGIDCDDNFQAQAAAVKTRAQALDFLHEMGWLLRWYHLGSRTENKIFASKVFSLERFKWLLEFSIEHDWCAVVKKLLDILLGGSMDIGALPAKLALEKMALLHTAVQKNSRVIVDLLLKYTWPDSRKAGPLKAKIESQSEIFLFRPDMVGPFEMTPLHMAASRDDTGSVLDALTNDPGQVGITAWSNARDKTGFTPADYARSRGFSSYIELVELKINKSDLGHVVDIPGSVSVVGPIDIQKIGDMPIPAGLQIDGRQLRPIQQPYCKVCSHQQLAYMNRNRSSLSYRPAMLSMAAIAAVCVCVGLLFKGPPEVMFVLQPFRWDSLRYGAM